MQRSLPDGLAGWRCTVAHRDAALAVLCGRPKQPSCPAAMRSVLTELPAARDLPTSFGRPVAGMLAPFSNGWQEQAMRKIRVGLIFGGKSAEHEVSLQSARNILDALDPQRFEPVLIGIDKQGQWHLSAPDGFLHDADDPGRIALHRSGRSVAVLPGA
ncbi:ATP-grasp enzyme, D-alanine-D-alanine ligase, partial [Xanthomonas vesicatoria ATCC 35937]